jgi:nucleotidyltransferase substrate binding protein (TIGR01987 family)
MIDYSKFRKSLKNLELQYANYSASEIRTELSGLDKEGLAESVIQRFEVCYDSAWKITKRYLVEISGLPNVPNSPKPILRLADENDLLTNEESNDTLERWLNYADILSGTSHDYAAEKAESCLAAVDDFIRDAIFLYQKLTAELWTQMPRLFPSD